MCSNFKKLLYLQFLSSPLLQSYALSTGMPPLELTADRHTSNFGKRKNHPTTYEESPKFVGPLVLPLTASTSDNRTRIRKFYLEASDESGLAIPQQPLHPLTPSARTDVIIKSIIDHFAYHDAPIDAKELAESVEFYLRCRKRVLAAGKKRSAKYYREDTAKTNDENNNNQNLGMHGVETGQQGATAFTPADIRVYDMCSGHGLTGMLFAACNPPTKDRIVRTICIDIVEPPSHLVLRNLIAELCPWMEEYDTVQFRACPLETFDMSDRMEQFDGASEVETETEIDFVCPIVISTHACGTLTDQVLKKAIDMKACAIASMPCCYTGTDKGVPYGIRRALGVAWSADIRRTMLLDSHDYHTDYSTIPSEITPLNRIIVAEDRS